MFKKDVMQFLILFKPTPTTEKLILNQVKNKVDKPKMNTHVKVTGEMGKAKKKELES